MRFARTSVLSTKHHVAENMPTLLTPSTARADERDGRPQFGGRAECRAAPLRVVPAQTCAVTYSQLAFLRRNGVATSAMPDYAVHFSG